MKRPTIKKPELLGDIDAKTTASLIGSCSDIALVMDSEGTVLDAMVQDTGLATLAGDGWKGRAWADTVTIESRDKTEALLREARAGMPTRWRQVNHPMRGHDDLPVLYAAVRLSETTRAAGQPALVAFGRDLRSTVQLQRRLVEAQQSMERDYWRFREAETRYRMLFQTAPEAVLIADAQTLKVLEANPAAEALLGRNAGRLVGAGLTALFEHGGHDRLQALINGARGVGSTEPARLTLSSAGAAPGQAPADVDVLAALFRQEQAAYLLIRVLPVAAVDEQAKRGRNGKALLAPAADAAAPGLLETYLRQASDALVFTDLQGRILRTNSAFAAMAQLSNEDQARGELLDRWLGRTGIELSVLLSNLRQHGAVGLFTTSLRGEVGAVHEVEISATQLASTQPPTLAFAVRDIGRRLPGEERAQPKLARTASELTELVGRVPMKDIVSETSDLIEQLCIEAALQMTNDNRALAAQFLGLSRQSLYVKLRRYGLGDLGCDNSD
ncbi:MAG: transcriptional regulator PpsR [Rubrivivax sp.]|nr:transcriptional regulator PpsR [Rubrivivax sp.]